MWWEDVSAAVTLLPAGATGRWGCFGLCPHRATSVRGSVPQRSPHPACLCFKQELEQWLRWPRPCCGLGKGAESSFITSCRSWQCRSTRAQEGLAQGCPWGECPEQGDEGAAASLFLDGEWDQHNLSLYDGTSHPGRAFPRWCWSMRTSREPVPMPCHPWQMPALCHGQPSALHQPCAGSFALCRRGLIQPGPA